MKKLFAIVLALSMVLTLAACGGGGNSSGGSSSSSGSAASSSGSSASSSAPASSGGSTVSSPDTSAASSASSASSSSAEASGLTEKIELVLGHGQQGSSEPGMALDAFAEKVKEDSNGMIEIKVYPASQLGGERDQLEGISMGTIDLAYISAGVVENYAPGAGIMNLPFIFDDYDHAQKVLNDQQVFDIISQELSAANITLLTPLIQGNRYLYSTRPVDFADLSTISGLKIRVPDAPMAKGIWTALKANPTAISWGELYTSMATKVVDAFEVHVWAVTMENLQETFQYAYTTGHQTSVCFVMASSGVWDSLPDEAKEIINRNIPFLVEENATQIITNEEKHMQTLRDAGIEITEVTLEQKDAIRDLTADLKNGWITSAEHGQQLYDIVQSLK